MKITDLFDVSLIDASLADAEEFICGTEYEIEDIKTIKLPGQTRFTATSLSLNDESAAWIGKIGLLRDGSLRNNGIEFITKPVGYTEALKLFNELHDGLELGPNPYTTRTSTHVHVNMASLSLPQIKHFLLSYALLEPAFFEVAGEVRKHNIHCVPLSFTLLPSLYNKDIKELIRNWSKYSALNLVPLRTQGTVEFRHLYGTGDKMVYQQWLSMLRDLWYFAYSSPPTALEEMLRANLSPFNILQAIVPTAPKTNLDFTASLIDVKLAF